MDPTDMSANGSEEGAITGLPTLPTLPATPTLPPPSSTAPASFGVEEASSMSLPPLRPNPAANASYGVLPVKPRAGEPSPATIRAAEQRRRMKKRRRIRRITMLIVVLVVGVFAGPPAVRWVADGFANAGSTETEPTTPADDTD
ncbi:MAG TPA: hypothetical protein VFV63_19500 [Ilumatobacteraceae bacterium]|nr:hypothetical protein [Ilumatobacteraceae bacterium]